MTRSLLPHASQSLPCYSSGRTKVDGFITVNQTAFDLFRDEFKLPLLPLEVAAYMATYAETLFPALLVLGLLIRLSAFALLIMTAVIEIFVYPLACPAHLTWATLMLYAIGHGTGKWSLDRVPGLRLTDVCDDRYRTLLDVSNAVSRRPLKSWSITQPGNTPTKTASTKQNQGSPQRVVGGQRPGATRLSLGLMNKILDHARIEVGPI